MRKLSTLFILATSVSMLYANCGNPNCDCGDDCQCPQMESHEEQDQVMQYQQQNETPDQQLASKVRDALYGSFSDKYGSVNVKVNNGTVMLTGTVASQDDKDTLGKKVSGVSGVQRVDNQVRVQNQ